MSAPNQLSFLPEDYLERKARRRANILCGAISLIVIGGLGATFSVRDRATKALDVRLVEVESDYAKAALRIEQVRKMHAKQKQIVQHAELASTLVERVPRSNVLAEFTNALPAGMSLLELSMDSRPRQRAAAAAANPNPTAFEQQKAAQEAKARAAEPQAMEVTLRLVGIADNDVQVGEFIRKLNASPLLRDVNLVISDVHVQDNHTMRRFQIEMMLNPDAEVREQPLAAKTAAVAVE